MEGAGAEGVVVGAEGVRVVQGVGLKGASMAPAGAVKVFASRVMKRMLERTASPICAAEMPVVCE